MQIELNGGFGPEYRLFPLVGDGQTAASAYRAEYRVGHPEPDDWVDAWFKDSPSLAAWLSGTGWREDEMLDYDAAPPQSWPHAADRTRACALGRNPNTSAEGAIGPK